MHFGSRTFVPISWMCKKQTSASHSSTEADVISLDASLRMDAIPAFDLWHLVIEVIHSSPKLTNKTKDDRDLQGDLSPRTSPNMRSQIPTEHINLELTNIDRVPSSVKHSGSSALWYVFDDNEVLIKMVMKARSATMYQGPTELLWIGCFIGLTWIPKFRSDTLIPNINSQTF